jgi:hypothetical protein
MGWAAGQKPYKISIVSTTGEQERLRLEIAAVLDAIAAQAGWSDDLWSRFHALLDRADVDGILGHADEELIHYSGEFNRRNRGPFRVKPDESQVAGYKSEFRQLAEAIRSGTTWEEYKRANRIYEAGNLSDALRRVVERVGKLIQFRK